MKSRLVWLVLCCIWGSTWLFIKLGLEAGLPPLTFAGIRFVIAAIILCALIAVRRVPLPRRGRDIMFLAVTGVLSFSLNYGLVFWGEARITSGLAALLQSTLPGFGLIIAHYYLPGERMTLPRIVGVLLGVVGVGVVFSDQLHVSPSALWGGAALVLSAFCAAYANVLVKRFGLKLQPSVLAAGQMIFGLVPLLLVGIPLEGNPLHFHWTATAVVALFYLAIVGSVIAFSLYYWLVQHMDVTKTMLIALITPVVAVTLGMLVLHEPMNWRTLAGGALILSGIGLIVTRRAKKSIVEVELVTGS